MDVLNAIAKVRFNSARPQRVQLSKSPLYVCDLLCMEAGQESSASGPCGYYVIAGAGQVKASRLGQPLALGCFVHCGDAEAHAVLNTSEQRLICLVISPNRKAG